MAKNVLITGATGCIGYHLCDKLYEDGYKVIATGRKDENKIKCHEFYTCNLKNIPWDELPNIDVCFHLAANTDPAEKSESYMMDTNYYTPMSVFKRLIDKNCRQFVNSSSFSVYGNQSGSFSEDSQTKPTNNYGKSMVDFEKFLTNFARTNRVNCINLRYSNVYGTYECYKNNKASMIHQLIYKFSKNEKPRIFKDGEQKRDWVYVKDVIDANILASNYQKSDTFNIGSGESISFNSLIVILNKKTGKGIQPEYIDYPFGEKYQNDMVLNLDKSKSKLKYHPRYSVEDGIQDIKLKLKRLFE